ncbi:MAG: endo-1,4-beta-xylanase [Hyphomicrobiaceae bacterium]
MRRGAWIDRRAALVGVGASLALARSDVASAGCASDVSLGALAQAAGVTFGCSIGVDALSDPAYTALVLHHARILTSDLAFKLPFINPQRGRFDFQRADQLVAFADTNRIPLRAHTLFWDLANPQWVTRLTARERAYEMDRIVDTVVGRYRGRIHSWDVVNEPFWPGFGEPGGFRKGAWYDAMGESYVMRAFKRAALADPAARLVLNCDMSERDDALGHGIRSSILRLVERMQDAGCRLDAVGLQGHLDPSLPFEPGAFTAFLARLAERKVDVYITELDVLDTGLPRDVATRDAAVAGQYATFLDAVLKVPAVKIVATWQLADAKSWYRSEWYRSVTPTLPPGWRSRPLPFDDRLQAKPAYRAMTDAFCSAAAMRRR